MRFRSICADHAQDGLVHGSIEAVVDRDLRAVRRPGDHLDVSTACRIVEPSLAGAVGVHHEQARGAVGLQSGERDHRAVRRPGDRSRCAVARELRNDAVPRVDDVDRRGGKRAPNVVVRVGERDLVAIRRPVDGRRERQAGELVVKELHDTAESAPVAVHDIDSGLVVEHAEGDPIPAGRPSDCRSGEDVMLRVPRRTAPDCGMDRPASRPGSLAGRRRATRIGWSGPAPRPCPRRSRGRTRWIRDPLQAPASERPGRSARGRSRQSPARRPAAPPGVAGPSRGRRRSPRSNPTVPSGANPVPNSARRLPYASRHGHVSHLRGGALEGFRASRDRGMVS